jgi:four helix bundle protein
MKKATSFEDLVVWQKAHQFVLETYRLTQAFPKAEIYGLTSQFRRASVSIAANIAEGFKKRGKADKARIFNIAQGSAGESRYYLILARDLGYAKVDQPLCLIEEVERMLETYSQAILDSIP